jgi:polygalacturonase
VIKTNLVVVKKFLTIVLLISCLSCQKEQESERFTLLPLQAGVNVMQQGAKGDGLTDDTDAFEKAMRMADSLRIAVFIPTGIYKADIKIMYDGIKLAGQGQPTISFKNGSIIIGSINCNNKKNIHISNLGIDARETKADAALTSGDGCDSVDLYQTFDHISLIGGGYHAYNHGILCQTGRRIIITNILVKDFFHGIAIRSSQVKLDSIEAISCGFTSIIVKSAENKNRYTKDVTITNVTVKGNSQNPFERGGTIIVQSFEDKSLTENIYIRKIISTDAGVSAVAIDEFRGKINNVLVEDCQALNQGDDAIRACFDINGGSNITLKNCSSMQARGTGFRCTGSAQKVRAEQCYESGSGMQAWWGNFSYLQLNGVEIIK